MVSCKHNFKQDTKMTEKVLYSTQDHLDTIADRGGYHVSDALQDRFFEVYAHSDESTEQTPEHESVYENIDQPYANQILSNIARMNKHVHAQHGNTSSHEEVWEESLQSATVEVLDALDAGVPEDTENAIMTLATMATLDQATSYEGTEGSSGINTLLEQNMPGTRDALLSAKAKAEELGLCVNTLSSGRNTLTSVAQTIEKDIKKFDDKIEDAHNEALREGIERRSPEENDGYLLQFAEDIAQHRNRLADGKRFIVEDDVDSYDQVMNIIASGNYSNLAASKFLGESKKFADYNNVAWGKYADSDIGYTELTNRLLWAIPDERLRSMYQSKDDKESGTLKYICRKEVERVSENDKSDISSISSLMTRIYGLDEINLKKHAASKDPTVQSLTEHPGYHEHMLESSYLIDRKSFPSVEQYNQRMERWTRDCLEEVIGLPKALAGEFQFAIYDKTHDRRDRPDGSLNLTTLDTVLRKTGANVEMLGLDNVKKLREKAGIVNFDCYTHTQLERMSRLIDGDKELIEHLQNGDTTAVFRDAKGDHNGAFNPISRVFEKPSGRSLFFEINQPSDFYRHSILLKNLGISDSTRVLAAHGGGGAMSFGKGMNRFSVGMSSHAADWTSSVKVGQVEGIRTIAQDYMQESRAIDDPDNMMGRKRLILISCSQAQERSLQEADGFRVGSTARSFASNADLPNLDVYGSPTDTAFGTSQGNDLILYGDGYTTASIRKVSLEEDEGIKLFSTEDLPSLELWK
jgi:hypothetical protein